MINVPIIQAKLAGLVGFRDSYNPKYAIIDAANKATRSGLIINDNPFVKIETIKDSQDYTDITDADFNNFLRGKIATSISNVTNLVFSDADYIDRQVLYRFAKNKYSTNPTTSTDARGDYVNVYTIPSGFNCYWIQVADEKNIAFKIERVFLEFNGTGNITLYLYNTSNISTPIASKTINITSPNQEVILDWVCDNTNGAYKGDYYLGYFQAECDASLQPFNAQYRTGLILAEVDKLSIYRYAFGNFTDKTKAFDLLGFTPYNYYNGINPDITVYYDYTDMAIQNEKLFAKAIQLDCQISLLLESVATLQSNRNERVSNGYAAQVMAQIEGETGDNNVKVKGIRPMFFGAIGTLKKEINKLRNGYFDANQLTISTLT